MSDPESHDSDSEDESDEDPFEYPDDHDELGGNLHDCDEDGYRGPDEPQPHEWPEYTDFSYEKVNVHFDNEEGEREYLGTFAHFVITEQDDCDEPIEETHVASNYICDLEEMR